MHMHFDIFFQAFFPFGYLRLALRRPARVDLTAIQIAEPIRLVVVDVPRNEEPPNPQALVNPEIVWSSEDRSTYEEGCLSIPEYYAHVEWPALDQRVERLALEKRQYGGVGVGLHRGSLA
jgi:peptide deformylase